MSRTHAVDAILRAMPDTGAVLEAGLVTAIRGDGLDTRLSVTWKGADVTDIPALGNNVSVGDQIWLIRSGQTLLALTMGDTPPPSLSLKGSVPTSGDLPAGPHDHGDAWITQDTGHLWYWSTESNQFIDGGPIVTTQHDALLDVRPDQHHSQSHEHDGLDGSGTVDHGTLTGVTSDQHHPQAHAHDGADGSGTVSHDDLDEVSANDHHNQQHRLYGSDQTDVDTAIPLDARHVLAVTPGGTDFGPETRMNWRGEWIDGVFYTHDVVRDGDWLMAANKETTDKAGPVAVGDPYFPYDGTSPAASTTAKTLITGNRYSFPEAGYFGGYRLNVVEGFHYTVFIIVDPDGIRDIRQLIDFNAISTGWVENSNTPVLVAGNTVFELLAYISEPDPSPTTWVGNWNYTTPNNENTPGAGTASQANKLLGVLKVNKTDADGGDRETELLALTIGDTISIASMSWVIQTITDSGNIVEFGIAPATQGSDGEQEFTFGTVTATPIPYIEDIDYWVPNDYIEGVYSDSGPDGIALNQNAYGVDIYVQRMSLSEDWDIMAITGAGGSGGGGDDGGSGVNPLPIGGAADQALVKIDGQDYNVKWAGPFLPTADYEPPTPQTYLHADLTDVTADQHHSRYADSEAVAAVDLAGYWDRDDLLAGAPDAGDRQALFWDVATETYIATPIEAAVRIMGSVDDEASLPPGPHDYGQGWITNDTGDLWIWVEGAVQDPPTTDGFKNFGPLITTSHAALSDVHADDHHARYTDAEAIAAGDGVYLPLAGGTMSGILNMNEYELRNVRTIRSQVGPLYIYSSPAATMGDVRFYLSDATGVDRLRFRIQGDGGITMFGATGATTMYWHESSQQFVYNFPFDMNLNPIRDLLDPVNPQDAATKAYVDANGGGTGGGVPHTVTTIEPPAPEMNEVWVDPSAESAPPSTNYLPLSGGVMSGPITMSFFPILDLADPSDPQDAATKAYADTRVSKSGDTITGAILTSYDAEDPPDDPKMLVTKDYVDDQVASTPRNFLPIMGGALTGGQTLTQSLVRNITVSNTAPPNPLVGDMWMEIA